MQKMMKGTLIFLSAMTFLNIQIYACSCAPKPTVLDEFERSAIVVTTRLAAVEKVRGNDREYILRRDPFLTMIVTKVYKGNVRPGQSLKFAQGNGIGCIKTYDESDAEREYLHYLDSPTKGNAIFIASSCGRSKSLDEAIDDVSYLDNIERLRGKTRLSGRLLSSNTSLPTGAVVKLKIIGKNKTYQIQIDKSGFYEIYDLPPGDYDVVPEIPVGWKIDEYMLGRQSTGVERTLQLRKEKNHIPVRITSARHIGLDLVFDFNRAP